MAEIELPADTLPKLKDASKKIGEVTTFINKAKAAGLDVSVQEKQLKGLKDQMRKVRDGFFPGETL